MKNKKLTDEDLRLWNKVTEDIIPIGYPIPNTSTRNIKIDHDKIANHEQRMTKTYQAIIDLHGSTQDEAYSILLKKLTDYKTIGYKCILIITGLGNINKNTGVLKRVIPEWMKVDPFLSIVKSTKKAKQEHGGEGALYILLN